MNLPTLSNFDPKNLSVIVRADLDGQSRLKFLTPLLVNLIESEATKIIIIGHAGRPNGPDPEFSFEPLTKHFSDSLHVSVEFLKDIPDVINNSAKLILIENLRFHALEEANDTAFAAKLANLADLYINEAFAVSHREHASVVALPKAMVTLGKKAAFGPHFVSEIENLDKALVAPAKPVITFLSGVKKDKLDYLEGFITISDQVAIAGRLPEYLDENYQNPKVIVGKLMPDKEDITINSIEKFEELVKSAGTIIVSGPLGKFEEPGHRLSTERVFQAIVANKKAFKLAGGGDTSKALTELNLSESFNWISTGGGAMLHYLTHHSLPAIEALSFN